jgi:glyoxylase-like metal-dependent hydrolase (beta-lactamase superfamily II)
MEIFKLVFSPIEVNTYILADNSGDCAVIDCGGYNDQEFKQLKDFFLRKKLNPVLLLNTHCHLDHIFGNGMMLREYNLKTYCSELDEPNRKDSVKHAIFFGLTMDAPPEPAGFLSDSEEVAFASVKLKALHVPGHAPGSLAFYSEKDDAVFTGDALFAGNIGRTDLPGGNYETLINSIKSKLFTLPPETAVYPGHGDETSIGDELLRNPYFR